MTISDLCINRPVFTWVLVAIPVVLGLVSYNELGVDLFPNVDFPVCTVTTVLPGASVEEMETTVSKPIEDIINTVSGIDELRSITQEGVSIVTVQFLLSKNGDVGTQEVRDKVNSILSDLPDGTRPPIVDKFDTGSMPVMTIAVSGRRDFREVTEIARKQIKERLETVPGVGAINLVGGRVRAMNVVVDTDRLAGYNLSVDDVRQALVRQNLEVPGGRVDQGPRELVLRTLGRLRTEREFNDLIIANRNGYPIRVRDIGHASDSNEEPRTLARLDGDGAVSLVVQKQSGVNTVKVVEDVKDRLGQLKAALPPDIATEIIRDQSRFIKKSIEEVKFHLLLAGVLVSATILLFIRDWRTTLIATLAIPTSIIPTFMFMRYMGFTLNNITMLGLILAIGIVIDDAVVVHENIFRHMEEDGMDGMEAARQGTREIALAVLATSLSLDRHLPADRLHGRDRRPLLLQLRADGRLRRGDEPVRLVHPDAHAVQPVPQAGTERIRPRPSAAIEVGVHLPAPRRQLRLGPARRSAFQVPGRHADHRGHRQHRADRQGHGHVAHSARRPERVRNLDHDARGLQPRPELQADERAGRHESGS